MRFVPIKTDDQLDLQALHRVRNIGFSTYQRHQPTTRLSSGARYHLSTRPGLLAETDTRTPRGCRTTAVSAYGRLVIRPWQDQGARRRGRGTSGEIERHRQPGRRVPAVAAFPGVGPLIHDVEGLRSRTKKPLPQILGHELRAIVRTDLRSPSAGS